MKRPINMEQISNLNTVISLQVFQQAESLFFNEDCQEAKDLLDATFSAPCRIIEGDVVEGDKLLALYGEIVFSLKHYSELKDFFPCSEILETYPRLQLLKLKLLDIEGDSKAAIERATRFIENNREPMSSLLPEFLSQRGVIRTKIGDVSGAITDLEVSFSFFLFQKKNFQMGISANRLGMLLRQTGDLGESVKWLERGLAAFTTLKMPRKQSMTLLNLGVTHYKTGNLQAATKTLLKSHKIGEAGNWPHRMLFTNIALANVLRMQRNLTEARQRLHTAYTQSQNLGYPREEALALEFLGDVYRDEGQHTQAQRYYARAMAIGKSIAPKGDIVMEIHRRQGECFLAQGELGQAVSELKKSIKMAQAQGDRFEEAVALRFLSEVKKEAGDLDAAEEFIDGSVEILEEIGARFELALSLASWSELKIRQVDRGSSLIPAHLLLAQAWSHATKSLDHAIFTGVAPLIEEYRQNSQRISALRSTHERAKNQAQNKSKTNRRRPGNVIIHQSLAMRDLLELTDMFADNLEPVLITGETGTGKELIARRLHLNSRRADHKLVSVNVTTLPATMFEREMFGHVRGSFSGADRDGPGYVGEADGGTLFLDEIGELPLEAQPKLLRLLQEGTYQALGDPVERYADIRIVAATNASLPEMVKQGKFRADLYFRLRILELQLPALRHREGDVPLLLRHFLTEVAGRQVELSQYFDLDSLDLLEHHDWSGNVRELSMLARRAHIELKSRGQVRISIQRANGSSFYATGPQVPPGGRNAADLEMEATAGTDTPMTFNHANERARIVMALDQSGGNRAEAAEALGMARSTLYRRMEKLGL